MSNVRRLFLVGAIMLFASQLFAQICPTGNYPALRYSGPGCPNPSSYTGSPCTVGSAVTLSLVDPYSGAPYSLQSCETGVAWTFGDGSTAQTTAATVQHTYATGGQFNVTAIVQGSSRSAYAYLLTATGTLSFSSVPPDVTEGGTSSVNVHTTYAPTSVSYQVYDYRNAAGRMTPVSSTLTFAAGEFDKTISIPTIDDSLYQGDGAIGVALSSPTNGVLLKDQYGGYLTSGSAFTYCNVLDNDPPPILNWSAPKYTVSEGAGSATLTVVRTGDLTRAVSVYYYVQSGPYTSGTLTFFANETTKTITVPIPNDSVWTPDRVWSIEITSPSGGAVIGSLPYYSYYSYTTLVITDDEPAPTISISDVSATEGNAGKTTANLTLTLSAPLAVSCSANITYSGTATRTIDYDATVSSVFFNAGETTKTIPITIYGDTLVERNETVVATIASVTNSYYPTTLNVPAITKGTGTVTILNDDVGMPWLKLAAGTSGQMTIYLGNPTAAQDTVTVTSAKPDVAKVPSSFLAQSGRSTLDFSVDAGTPGTSLITVKFPPSLGGTTLTANVDVYTPAALAMQPPSLSIPVNTTSTLTVTMSPAPPAPVTLKITPTNASLIQVPADFTIDTTGTGIVNVKGLAVGNAALTLTLPAGNGGFDTTVAVNVTAPPTGVFVTQVAPANGPTAGGTATTITGLNFNAPCSVTFGGNAASDVTFVNSNSLKATTTPHAAGPADVSVTCGTDHYTFANGFTFLANAPRLASLSPVSGSTRGGTVVVITGTDLRSSCGILFGGALAKIITDLTPDKLAVVAPPHAAGAVDVTLQCSDSSVALTSAFAYVTSDEASAIIGDVDPLAAAAGQTVSVNGVRFRPSDAITFGDTRANILSTLPTTHVVVVPAVPPGRLAITLTDPDGHLSTTGPVFTVLEPVTPEITSVSPPRVAPGGEIVINGKGFRALYSFTLDNKNAGKIVDLSFNRAVVRVDAAFTAGTYTLGVMNANGNLAAVGPKIDVVSALSASSMTPFCAMTSGGTDVTITGSGFQAGAGVTFGNAAATNVRVVDTHTIIVTVPEGKIGWPTVTVTNSNGDAATLTRGFYYYSPYDLNGGCSSTKTRGARH